jgi:GT2 family glycosyltransferase
MDFLFSVVLCTWKRYAEINTVVNYYKKHTDDIVIWDNGGQVDQHIENKSGILIIKPSENIGSCAKFKATAFAKYNYILISDDDVIPEEGFIEELHSSYQNNYADLMAIFGRKFPEGGGYNHDENQRVRSKDINTLTTVDFLGQLYFGHRDYFTVDFKNTKSVYDDIMLIWLQNQVDNPTTRQVFPTKKYHYSSDMIGKHELCNQPEFYKKRDKLAKAIWQENHSAIYRVLNGEDI